MGQKNPEIVCLDTNIVLRFLLKDDSVLSQRAEKIFRQAELGILKLYMDEVILAESIWVLLSSYKLEKQNVCHILTKFLSARWLVNPRKRLMVSALTLFSKTRLHYPDCWLFTVTNNLGHRLETFDLGLQRMVRDTKNPA